MIPGSALRKLEAQTGLDAGGCGNGGGFYLGDLLTLERDEKKACAELRQRNWKRVCERVALRQEYRCNRCQQIKPLEGHHVITRARWRRQDGPLDIESNIECLCPECHGKVHRG